jgi:hypothetical protein
MTPEQETAIGAEAQRIHDSIRERLDVIRENLHREWEKSKAEDRDGREHAWSMLKALNELERSYLKDIMTGKLAQKQIEDRDGRTNS